MCYYGGATAKQEAANEHKVALIPSPDCKGGDTLDHHVGGRVGQAVPPAG